MKITVQPKILVFAGSTRSASLHRKLAALTAAALRAAGAEVTEADLRDYPMPLYDGDLETAQGLPPRAKAFKKLVRSHDAFVIASPEYNGSFPALVKNAIDWISRSEPGEPRLAAFAGKIAGVVAASPGPVGGARGLRHLRELLEMIGVKVIPAQVTVPKASQAFAEDGSLVRLEEAAALREFAYELVQATVRNSQAAAA